VALLGAKLIAMIASGSMSVLASLADSLLDLVSGIVLAATQRAMARVDPYKFPEGKARLEPIGVVVFAVVMGMSSLQIIVEATKRLIAVISKSDEVPAQYTSAHTQFTNRFPSVPCACRVLCYAGGAKGSEVGRAPPVAPPSVNPSPCLCHSRLTQSTSWTWGRSRSPFSVAPYSASCSP